MPARNLPSTRLRKKPLSVVIASFTTCQKLVNSSTGYLSDCGAGLDLPTRCTREFLRCCCTIFSEMPDLSLGRCEHCTETFGYRIYHCGFGDCSYAYCDKCGMTAVLSYWSKGMPKMPRGCPQQQEICAELEQYLEPCPCGGAFKKNSSPRCPQCEKALSAQVASHYIESNAPGTKKGWRWQGNWHATYCIVIEKREVRDNFKPAKT